MKLSNPIIFWLLIITLGCLLVVAVWYISPVFITSPRETAQQELAKELEVRIEDYPHPFSFPTGYFSTVLKPGMSKAEVHKIVWAYKQVLHCGTGVEVYYYLNAELGKDTERFRLFYDEQGKLAGLEAEDTDSRMIFTDNCTPGLLKE